LSFPVGSVNKSVTFNVVQAGTSDRRVRSWTGSRIGRFQVL
jgi:hypothetical protein